MKAVVRFCRGQGHLCLASASLTGGERFLRAYHAELVSLGVSQDGPGPCALLVRSGCRRFLTVFGSVTGIRHRPAAAFSRVPMTISPSRAQRTFQPGACVRNRAGPGRL
jgi:hypothetical protein